MSELIIFDLDGVLVDTQDAENGALAYLGGLMGLRLEQDEANALFAGKRMQECIDLMVKRSGHAPPAGAMGLVRARCEELIGDRMEPIAGVADALARIGARKCVASNSPRAIIERRLRGAGLLDHFGDRLFSAYEISAWKPDPKLFLWAADECGSEVDACVVVEDSAVGVGAAVKAGMRVLQYAADPAVGPHGGGVRTFADMARLPDLLRRATPELGC